MEAHTFLIQIVVILLSARLFGELAAYCGAPSVIGELFAGFLIGPSLLGLMEISPPIQLLAQIGIILLLFEVGLESDVGKLVAAGLSAFLVAVVGVVLPFALGFVISYFIFHFSLLASLFIGGTLTATSIDIAFRVLRHLKKEKGHESQIIMGACIFDDIIGILLLALLYEFATEGSINLLNTGRILLFIILFLLISPVAAKAISFIIKKWEEKSEIPGLLPVTIVSLILIFAWIAHELEAPELLGGFAAGLALSRKSQTAEFSHRVEKQMEPIVQLFAPIFFVSIGLSLNLREWHSPLFTGMLLLAAIVGKLLSGFILFKEPTRSKLFIGTAMIPRGEVGFIFAKIGLTVGVLKQDIYASVILVIALTTLLAPFSLKYLFKKEQKSAAQSL